MISEAHGVTPAVPPRTGAATRKDADTCASDLTLFLSDKASRPFTWGQDDCCLFLADWWNFNHRADPAAHLRGTYADIASKAVVVVRAGGIVRLVANLAKAVGAKRARAPSVGAFGLIRSPVGIVGAICTGDYWAVRTEEGVGFLKNPKIVRAWTI